MCDFCKCLELVSECNKRNLDKRFRSGYSVALVDETYQDDVYRGRVAHYGYDLNYCPECGKRI